MVLLKRSQAREWLPRVAKEGLRDTVLDRCASDVLQVLESRFAKENG